jgi:uncharacterized membrane protein YdbT with pleckstrin-like domain
MGFIDRNLMEGEQLVYRTRLHWAVLFGRAALLAVLLVATLAVVAIASDKRLALIPLALLVIAAFSGLGKYLTYVTTEFGVTTYRVLIKTGWLTLRSTEILLSKVEAVQIEQNLWGRLLNYGSIIITGTGGTHEVFHMIEAPYELRNQVQRQLMPPPEPARPAPRRYD